MKLAVATRALPREAGLAEAASWLRERGVDRLVLDLPGPVRSGVRADLRERGVVASGVAVREVGLGRDRDAAFAAARDRAVRVASALKAETVVLEGAHAFPTGRDEREHAIEGAARALHGPLKEGVPFVVRHGAAPDDLLGAEETEWLLDALPTLGLMLDPFEAATAPEAPSVEAWVERFGRRTVLVAAHGPGLEGGGGHPADAPVDWRALFHLLPADATWVLDLDPRATDLGDALRYLRDRLGG